MKKIPDSELEVMQIIWECEAPVSRRQIEEIMQQKHPVATTTLLTLLTRLADKGFIRIDKQGRSSVYTPIVNQQDYLTSQSRTFVDKLFGGSIPAFASALCDGGLTQEELEELKKLLEQGEQ